MRIRDDSRFIVCRADLRICFPACLICAICEKEGKMGSTVGSCVSFGRIMMALILI